MRCVALLRCTMMTRQVVRSRARFAALRQGAAWCLRLTGEEEEEGLDMVVYSAGNDRLRGGCLRWGW